LRSELKKREKRIQRREKFLKVGRTEWRRSQKRWGAEKYLHAYCKGE
jgi:hypothetical protein